MVIRENAKYHIIMSKVVSNLPLATNPTVQESDESGKALITDLAFLISGKYVNAVIFSDDSIQIDYHNTTNKEEGYISIRISEVEDERK